MIQPKEALTYAEKLREFLLNIEYKCLNCEDYIGIDCNHQCDFYKKYSNIMVHFDPNKDNLLDAIIADLTSKTGGDDE